MDDSSLLGLENELKRLRPRTPSVKLLRRVEAGLAQAGAGTPSKFSPAPASRRPMFRSWLNGWTAAAAAAAVFATVMISFRRPAHSDTDAATPAIIAAEEVPVPTTPADLSATDAAAPVPAVDRYQPVGAASVLYDLQEDRVVIVPSSTPVRRLRYRYVDTYTWKNPATNASLQWSLPRDEVRVLPASSY